MERNKLYTRVICGYIFLQILILNSQCQNFCASESNSNSINKYSDCTTENVQIDNNVAINKNNLIIINIPRYQSTKSTTPKYNFDLRVGLQDSIKRFPLVEIKQFQKCETILDSIYNKFKDVSLNPLIKAYFWMSSDTIGFMANTDYSDDIINLFEYSVALPNGIPQKSMPYSQYIFCKYDSLMTKAINHKSAFESNDSIEFRYKTVYTDLEIFYPIIDEYKFILGYEINGKISYDLICDFFDLKKENFYSDRLKIYTPEYIIQMPKEQFGVSTFLGNMLKGINDGRLLYFMNL